MPADALIPESWLALIAAATIFTVMFGVGLGTVLSEFRWVLGHPGRIAKGLFAVLVAVPAIALVVVRAFDLPRAADVGLVLMAISPGAPIALRRSLDAGGHRSFAPALQILVALLAVVSMPVTIAVLNHLYAGRASIEPWVLAKQVFVAQLLPLGFGMATRKALPSIAAWVESWLAPVATILLLLLTLLVVVDVWRTVIDAGPRIVLAIATLTALALATGHLLGGPEPETRTAVAISSAARNPGLALLIAAVNSTLAGTVATIFAYLVVSGLVVLGYALLRRRALRTARLRP